MKIIDLTLRNFLPFEEVKLQLEDRGLVAIQGQNLSDTSADSNGSGKSAIGEGLNWILWGETTRGLSGADVNNSVTGKRAEGILSLLDGESLYVIKRLAKFGRNAEELTLEEICASTRTITNLTAASIAKTQEKIERLLGLKKEVFQQVVYLAQEEMPDLPGMTDKQLKIAIEQAAGITILETAYRIALAERNAKQKDIEAEERAFAHFLFKKEHWEGELDRFEKLTERWKEENKAERKRLASIMSQCMLKNKEIDIDLSKIDQTSITKQIEDLNEQDLRSEKGREKETKALLKVETYKERVRNALLTFTRAKDDIKKVDKCPTCGQDINSEHAHNVVNAAKKNAALALKALNEQREQLKIATDEHKNVVALRNASTSHPTTQTDKAKLRSDLNAKLIEFNRLQTFRSDVVRRLDEVCEDIKEFQKKECPYVAEVKKSRENVELARTEFVKISALLEKLKGELELLEEAVKVYGPTGVRVHILDAVTPFLNERTEYYLQALTDGSISANWTTLSLNKSGELKEKFSIEVLKREGAKNFKGLSGGQKRKVRLATAMALQDLVSTRVEKPIAFCMMDEIDDALDEAGLERLMGVLEEKARERGTVLIISHNSLTSYAKETLLVVNENNIARIENI